MVFLLTFLLTISILFIVFREKHFHEKLNLNKRFFDELPFEAVIFDDKLRFVYITGEAVKNKEMRDWLIGKTEADYWTEKRGMPEVAKLRYERLLTAIENRETISYEEKIIDREGNEKYYMRRVKPIFDNKGKLVFVMGMGFDFSELIKKDNELEHLNQELKRSNEDLDNFAHVASHDLKAPLRSITSFLQLLQRRNRDRFDSTDHEYLNFALRSTGQLNSLIQSLLDYSCINKQTDTLKIIDLNTIVDLTKSNLFSILDERQADITFDYLPQLTMHDFHIKQLIQNLIQNGLKYNRNEKPLVKVFSKEREDGVLVMAVQDNGIGIHQEFQDKVFQVFRRLHSAHEFEGSGIGLAACKRIVEFYDGEIWFESAIGEGTTFYFTLPNAQPIFEKQAVSYSLNSVALSA